MKNNENLKVKDLITLGIYMVIYFVLMSVVGLIGVIPIVFMIWPFVNAVVCGIIVMLFMTKVQKPWALFLFGMFAPTLMFIMGHSYIVFVHGLVVMLIAEFVRRRGDFHQFKYEALANAFFSCWACGSLMQMLWNHDFYMEMNITSMGEEYARAMERLITYPHMALVYLGAFVGGLISAWLAKKLLKKHFEKAGII